MLQTFCEFAGDYSQVLRDLRDPEQVLRSDRVIQYPFAAPVSVCLSTSLHIPFGLIPTRVQVGEIKDRGGACRNCGEKARIWAASTGAGCKEKN